MNNVMPGVDHEALNRLHRELSNELVRSRIRKIKRLKKLIVEGQNKQPQPKAIRRVDVDC